MSDLKSTGRDLRALWATLAMICLLGAAVAYGVTRYRLMELEQQAGRDARKLAVDVIQPALTSGDVSAPIRGERLAEVRSSIQADLLAGPVNAVRIWSEDGTIVFADDPEVIGEHDPAIRDEIRTPATGTTVHGFTTGQRFHSLVVMHVGDPPTLMAAELVRPHEALVAKAEDPWYPWVSRAIWFAIAFAVLYVVTWLGFAAFGIMRRGIAHRKAKAARERQAVPGRRGAVTDENLPAYMQPGFRAEVESRERVEQELSSTAAERDELARRLQQAQVELQRSTASSGVESA
ncbi:MAG TPA: hypothetical protein VFM81_04660 [Actinomycetota bacterium]|nr:hypothetical protein [Actinomycetota bacterium]